MVEVELYLDERGRSPFERWRADLDAVTRARISKALERLVEGNTSNVKGVSGGVSELKIDTGPGYRLYFGWEGQRLIILLGGGAKKGQQKDIAQAIVRWARYKKRTL